MFKNFTLSNFLIIGFGMIFGAIIVTFLVLTSFSFNVAKILFSNFNIILFNVNIPISTMSVVFIAPIIEEILKFFGYYNIFIIDYNKRLKLKMKSKKEFIEQNIWILASTVAITFGSLEGYYYFIFQGESLIYAFSHAITHLIFITYPIILWKYFKKNIIYFVPVAIIVHFLNNFGNKFFEIMPFEYSIILRVVTYCFLGGWGLLTFILIYRTLDTKGSFFKKELLSDNHKGEKMSDLKDITENAAGILKEIKLGNGFLYTGSLTILISIFISSEYTLLGLKIGIMTLVFGGVFRLLNMVTKTLIEDKKDKNTKKRSFIKWNILRFSIWIIVLLLYVLWIDTVIDIIPKIW